MSNFRSFIEQTVHPHLQNLTRFQAPIRLFVALAAFSRIPIIGSTSSASLSTLTTALGRTLAHLYTPEGIPLPTVTSLFGIVAHGLHTTCLRMRIQVRLPIQLRDMLHQSWASRSSYDDTYATARAEAKYWRVAGRYQQRLYSGNGACTPVPLTSPIPSREGDTDTVIPLVMYYTPRLLPVYRRRNLDGGRKRHTSKADADPQVGRITPRTFCKWHRMVFQDAYHHPTFAQAAEQIKYYSNRDLREIQRIARLLPDDQVFCSKGKCVRKSKDVTKYKRMWQHWLENKGMDLVIVFE